MIMGRKQSSAKKIADIVNEESAANFARRRPIPDDFYFTPDISDLPMKEYADAKSKVAIKQVRALKLANAKMIRLPRTMTNLEIKMEYGPANLETVTNGEEIYQAFLESLIAWADALSDERENEDAKKILEKSIDLGCDVSRCFLSLAKLYAEDHDKTAIEKLMNRLDIGELIPKNEAIRKKTVAEIRKMYNNI